MARIRFTKNALRDEQRRLTQFERYLPTLQLKKALLQMEVNAVISELEQAQKEKEEVGKQIEEFSFLLYDQVNYDLLHYAQVKHVNKVYENIAGVEIAQFQNVIFVEEDYSLFDSPPWAEKASTIVKYFVSLKEKILVIREKKAALEKELKDVSIRVNLFEKVLIPRAKENIRKIKVFLSDQQLAAIAQAKVAKAKIEEKMESFA